MKLLRLALLLTLCLCMLASCQGKDDWHPAGMKTVKNENVDYTVYVPEDWTVELSTGITTAYNPDDRSNISITAFNLETEDNYITPSEYWARYAEDCRKTFTDFQYLVEENAEQPTDDKAGTQITLGGTAAMKYQFSCNVTGQEYHYTAVICIRGGYAYMLTYTAKPDFYALHEEEINNILTNFAFR